MTLVNQHYSTVKQTDLCGYVLQTATRQPTFSTIPLKLRKNITIIPNSRLSQDSSKRMNQDKKRMNTVLCRKAQPLTESNFKISKTGSLTSLTPVKTEENIISKLKKLPDITFDLVKTEPIFKIPKIPKFQKNNIKTTNTHDNKSKVFYEKKLLLEKQDNNTIDKNIVVIDTIDLTYFDSNINKTSKNKKKQIDNNIPIVKKNVDQIISKNLKSSPSKYLYSEKENEHQRTNKQHKQITSSPRKTLKKIHSKTKSANSKTVKSAEQESNSSIDLPRVLNSDSIVKSTTIETHEFLGLKSDDENYTLMDLSTTGQVNIVSTSRPNFIDVSNAELQINEIDNNTKDISNDHFLQGMKIYIRNFLKEEVPVSDNKLSDCPKLIQEILPNTEQFSSNVKSNDNINCTKRWQPQNDLHKKQKTVV